MKVQDDEQQPGNGGETRHEHLTSAIVISATSRGHGGEEELDLPAFCDTLSDSSQGPRLKTYLSARMF